MRQGASRWGLSAATAALAVALWFVLPWFAASVVRGAIERDSARDRAAFAAGGSPWTWRFETAEDVVAGRAFGEGRLSDVDDAVRVQALGDSGFNIGLPMTRPADLRRTAIFRIDASATIGRYGLIVRETLSGPVVQADLGVLTEGALNRPWDLRRLAWTNEAGQPVAAPSRAAMMRLAVRLPPRQTLTLRRAGLSPPSGFILPASLPIPPHLSAEALLAWRDSQRDADPLATFGDGPTDAPTPVWRPWLVPALYLILILVVAARRRSRAIAGPVLDAALALAGPLWFIATLGLSGHPPAAGVTTFAIGVVYALFLSARRRLPPWHVLGSWRHVSWPLLAVPVTLAIVLAAGHAPVWPPGGRVLVYLGWALFQQWLMLAVVGALLARALPRPAAVLITALAFALLHTPNGLLMQLCFVAELGWGWWYLHHRSLLPVAVAHAASAVLLQACLAGGLLRSLEVSARFLG